LKVLILANPASGRDVRRLAARASTMTHETKRDWVARIATGLDAAGVEEIFILREPARIASSALQWMPLRARVTELEVPITNSAADTVAVVRAARDRGCSAIVSMGGDGTNRIIARTWPEVPLLPLSTGTNNVFPVSVEATSAGLAAGMVATGQVPLHSAAQRCKLLHVQGPDWTDLAVIDAVLLHDDHTGNALPFDAARIAAVALTRAEPAAVGMSPLGGFLQPVGFADEGGLLVRCATAWEETHHAIGGAQDQNEPLARPASDQDQGQGQGHGQGQDPASPSARSLQIPLSPGLFGTVRIRTHARLRDGETCTLAGPGVIAFDGDRLHALGAGDAVHITVRRDGPWIIDTGRCLDEAARSGRLGLTHLPRQSR
jgi:hypothetical protein